MILEAWNKLKGEVLPNPSTKENEFKPRIQSTVKPKEQFSFNEVFENAHNELKNKFKNK